MGIKSVQAQMIYFFVLRKKGSKTKERMKEEEIEKGACGPPTRKVKSSQVQVRQNQKKQMI